MGKLIDLTGQRFGRWIVLKRDTSVMGHNTEARWFCKCDCGTVKSVTGRRLRNGGSKSCGCFKNEVSAKRMSQYSKKHAIDLTNQKFGFLTALYPTEKRLGTSVVWRCKCSCGKICDVAANSLRSGNTKSCGCIGRSTGEKYIELLLKENNIKYQREYKIEDNSRFDFFLPELNRLIEFDGEQHYIEKSDWRHITLEEQQNRDKVKNKWAAAHNIPLVRIPYWERDKITLDMLLGNTYLVK